MSKTKQTIADSVLAEIFQRHQLGEIVRTEALTGGKFNTVLKITTQTGKAYAIKIAPAAETPVLTYEKNLISSEVAVCQMLSEMQCVRFPAAVAWETDTQAPYQYLIMEFLEGEMLSNLRLSRADNEAIMFDLGKAMAEMHTVQHPQGFGYLQTGLKPTWKEAYLEMIDNIFRDAAAVKAKIPYEAAIRQAIHTHESVLETVTTPTLVHFDLWKGNLMIKDKRLYALIDCERTMFGDIMGEFISLDYAAPFDTEKNKMLLKGYAAQAGKAPAFSREETVRLYLMKLYLGLIVCVEANYRVSKFSPEYYGAKAFAKSILGMALRELNA